MRVRSTRRINQLNRFSFKKGMPMSAHIEFREIKDKYGDVVETRQVWVIGNKMPLWKRHLAHAKRNPNAKTLNRLL